MKRTNTASWDEKNKRWRIAVQKDGVRKNFYSSTPGRTGQREANKKADDWLERDITEKIRCDRALDLFVENIKKRTSYDNYEREERNVRLYIKPVIKNLYVSSINEAHLQEAIDKQAKRLAKKSLMNLKYTITAFVKFCRKNKWTNLYPENLSVPKNAPTAEKVVLQPEDVSKLFSTDLTIWKRKQIVEPYVWAWRFQVATGLRPGELFGLKWKDIKGDYVYLKRSINQRQAVTKGKNENAVRSFKLTPLAKYVLANQPKNGEYVFPVDSGKQYRTHLARFCEANQMTVVTPYELRHTFVSMAKTLPVGLVKSIVGHSKNMDTFGVYGHALNGDEDVAAEMLQEIFDKII